MTAPASNLRRPRWWPAIIILVLAAVALYVIRSRELVPYQKRNLDSLKVILVTSGLLVIWWLAFSRTRWTWRLGLFGLGLAILGGVAASVRIGGVSGDLLPILEFRWSRRPPIPNNLPPAPGTNETTAPVVGGDGADASGNQWPDFPQFLGPDRTAVLAGPALSADWKATPPRLVWKQPIGAAWSGFVITGDRAFTQEQRGDEELVTCYDLATGRLRWVNSDPSRYRTTIAGEGPRCTPTVAGDRVYTLGATGLLNCLEAATGRRRWQRTITEDAGSKMPEWGFSGSPLLVNGRVLVGAGGKPDKSMIAYDAGTGEIVWTRGGSPISHSSPFSTTLAGIPQILMFNSSRISAHDAQNGKVLWEYPWDAKQPHVAVPIVVGSNRVVFSSGYGVGAELLEIESGSTNTLAAKRVWRSIRMKAKFSNPVARDGFLYGLDDGVLACVDLRDGTLKWKEGRYGHGQGLLVGEHYLLMAENGELVLLRPTPDAPNELGRFRVFTDKTWNPIALSGPTLLVRNDREAACLRLKLARE